MDPEASLKGEAYAQKNVHIDPPPIVVLHLDDRMDHVLHRRPFNIHAGSQETERRRSDSSDP